MKISNGMVSSSFLQRFPYFVGLLVLSIPSSPLRAGQLPVAWGANDALQCVVPGNLTNVVAVAGGESHSLALKSDGTVAAWGFNFYGQAIVPSNLTSVVAVAGGGSYSIALRNNGTVASWGSITNVPADLTNATAIAGGWSHLLALRNDTTVVSWGSLSNVPPGLTNIIAISAGSGYSLALNADGTVTAWGDNSYGQLNIPSNATNIVAIAAGGGHCLALQSNGRVVAWGRNDFGQTTVPASLSSALAISAGGLHSVALKPDGSIIVWGNDSYGQVSTTPSDTGYIALAAGGYHNLALKGAGAPFIFLQPASQTAIVSKNATFQVGALGAQPLHYQWRHVGTNLNGATLTSLTLRNIQLTDGGAYTVVVTNTYGSVTSAPAILTPIGVPPYVISPPTNTSTICGEGASFRVRVDGSAPFSYQWEFAGTNIPGATRTSLNLTNVDSAHAGLYSVVITNAFGSVTTGAVLTVTVESPSITSPLTANGIQGFPFTYQITGLHTPVYFTAEFLPNGLVLNPTNGLISGVPEDSGMFGVIITDANACTNDSELLILTFDSGLPVLTSPLIVTGTESLPLTYQITATMAPTTFGAQSLPSGLAVDPGTGLISGMPTFAGEYDSTIWASNTWGVGSANLHFSITNMVIDNLNIGNVTFNYSAPYLLDFQFTLSTLTDTNDPNSSVGVVVNPRLLSAACFEDGVSPSESGTYLVQGNSKVIKVYLVLDFTASIASMSNGDTNQNGISDAVDFMLAGADEFVNEQPSDTQVGVYEFHRDDMSPSNVVALTTDKALLTRSIDGIWTNYVQGFSSGSRCWDALVAAVGALGPSNRDEQHYIVFVSDGRDESSLSTLNNVLTAATNAGVKVFAVGFGDQLDPVPLQTIASQTAGSYFTATNPADLATQFGKVAKTTKGQYILRWATLKRSSRAFMPSFQISYQGLTAFSPTNPVYQDTNNPIVDTNTVPPTTNYNLLTNFVIAYYTPTSNAGPVTVGSLRVVPETEVLPTAIDLRATYTPRYIRQMRFHYRPNWPCTPILQSTNAGEMLAGWTLSQTNDGAGGEWMLLSSSNPADLATSIPFTAFGKLVKFEFQDVINPTNAFTFFTNDNTLYTNTGGQSFRFENTNQFITLFPTMPHGTPVPWLITYGYGTPATSNAWALAELADPDGDGMPNWKEYWANTIPTNAASKFAISSLVRQPDGRFRVTFSTSTNRTYRVDASTDLLNWQIVEDNIPGVNQDVTIVDTRFLTNITTIYYRAVVY
jgi:hypothetical protein